MHENQQKKTYLCKEIEIIYKIRRLASGGNMLVFVQNCGACVAMVAWILWIVV